MSLSSYDYNMTSDVRPLQRYLQYFSGPESKLLWKSINRLRKKDERIWNACYELALRCAELEGVVHALERRVARLETHDSS